MELPLVQHHSVIEAIRSSYNNIIPSYKTGKGWIVNDYTEPEIVKVGQAYCCAQCCGVLHYGAPPKEGEEFYHHKCHARYNVTNTPLNNFARTGRITRHIFDAHCAALTHHIRDITDADDREADALIHSYTLPDDVTVKVVEGDYDTEVPGKCHPLLDARVDPEFWKEPFMYHHVSGNDTLANDKVVHLTGRLARILDGAKMWSSVLSPPETHMEDVLRGMQIDANPYEWQGTRSGALKIGGRGGFIFNEGKQVSYSFRKSDLQMTDSLKLDNHCLSPMPAGVMVQLRATMDGPPSPSVYICDKEKAEHYRNIMKHMLAGWHQSAKGVAFPLGVEKMEQMLHDQAHEYFGGYRRHIKDLRRKGALQAVSRYRLKMKQQNPVNLVRRAE
nr:sigmaB [Reptilian orthoreovirus]